MSPPKLKQHVYEPRHMKKKTAMWFPTRCDTNQAVQAQKMLETGIFGFRKQRNINIRVAKIKAVISFAVTAKLICAFVFAKAKIRFLTMRLIS